MTSPITILEVKPTVYFIETPTGLRQRLELRLGNNGDPARVTVRLEWDGQSVVAELERVDNGVNSYEIYMPDIRVQTELTLALQQGEETLHTATVQWKPTKHWEVCFVPITHHDLGYTDTIEELYEYYAAYYDNVLKYCEETEHFPDEAKYRFTVEETWSLVQYLRNRPKETANKFMAYAGQGRIEVSALYANIIDAMCGHEELNRLLYPSFKLRREHGIPLTTASVVDIPGLSWGLASTLRKAGIQYLFAGLPTYFEWGDWVVPSFWDEQAIMKEGRPGAFRWEGPDGSSVLVYYCGGYGWFLGGHPSSVTSPDTFDDVKLNLEGFLEEMDRHGSPFSVVRYIDHGVDNYPPQRTISYIAREWNRRYAYPKLIVSTNRMFFEKLDKQCRDVPVYRGEIPHTDYAVGALCAAKETSINRNTHSILSSAEQVATLNALLTRSRYPGDKIRQAYMDMMLYDEHCFGMAQPIGSTHDWNWNMKSSYAYRAAACSQNILRKSAEQITAQIGYGEDAKYITVFNTLSFTRSELVRVHNFPHYGREFDLIDTATGRAAPTQLIVVDHPDLPVHYASGRYALGQVSHHKKDTQLMSFTYTLVFQADELPAMGYKTYRIVEKASPGQADNDAAIHPDWQLENAFYKVTLDSATGAVSSVLDKQLQRELVDQASDRQLNQLVVRSVQNNQVETQRSARMLKHVDGPVFQSIVVASEAPGCPKVVQEIILYHQTKKIDVVNRILKDETPLQEIYIAFPFDVERPDFRFEGTNSVIRPFHDQLPGTNTNHYTVQHWAQVRNDTTNIVLSPVDSHILGFGGMWPNRVSHAHHGVSPVGYENRPITQEQVTKGHIYAFVINSNFRTNFAPTQLCDVIFRFSITSDRDMDTNPYRFGWSSGVAPVPVWALNRSPEATLPLNHRFAAVGPDHVFLMTCKQAEDGNGLIVRFIEMEGQSAEVSVELAKVAIYRVYLTNNMEENQRVWSFQGSNITFPIKPYETVTFRIELGTEADKEQMMDFFQRVASNKSAFLT